jgi:peptidoglycan/LPS O-acetylase OafA/YrhL
MAADNGRLPGLDLLRGIAIVWVMLSHSFLVGGLGADWQWLSRYGWMGVDLFFVLSGFLIGCQVLGPMACGGHWSFRDFYLRRAFRILPAYWTVLTMYVFWPAFREAPGMESAWKFLVFGLNLGIDYNAHAAFSHAWSLCVEEHFYLLFPLLAWWLLRRPATWKFAAVCACVMVAGIGLRTTVWRHDMTVDPGMSRSWFLEDIYYPTWNRLDGLLVGVALAAWKVFRPQAWERARRHANLFLLAGMATMALALWMFRDRVGLLANSIGWPVLSMALGLLVFAGAGRDSVIGRRSLPGAQWLATISYSLYLVHKATYHLVQARWGTVLSGKGIIAFCVYGLAAISAAAVLHYAVERPFLRVRQRLLFTRTQPMTVAPA